MEFLIEYGLFLAKVATFVVALIVVIGFVVATSHKGGNQEKGNIVVTNLNDRFDDMHQTLKEVVWDDGALKEEEKQLKKTKKLEKKQEKKDRKSKKKDNGTAIADEAESARKKRVYVLDFDGDIKASESDSLREEITAVLSLAEEKDEVVLKLESPGGMVHGYGLAASQLARITKKGIPLTVCVDKVAASGGYMMACVADKILAAPFAVIGSIGVVAQLPNFHKVLKKYDVDYEIFTAGKYKRTVTMLGENTETGRKKFVEDLEDTHELFKDFISEHRSEVDLEDVATGEIWFGRRALGKSLIDGISTSDEYLTGLHPDADILAVDYEFKKSLQEKLGVGVSAAIEKSVTRLVTMFSAKYWAR